MGESLGPPCGCLALFLLEIASRPARYCEHLPWRHGLGHMGRDAKIKPMVEFHVIFQEGKGPVQECRIEAESIADCEQKFQQAYPQATYWTVGAPMEAFT